MNKDESLKATGEAAAASLRAMVAALECDYDRLGELRDERTDLAAELEAADTQTDMSETITRIGELNVEIAELEEVAGECTSREEAEQRIHEDALSCEVRSGWVDGYNFVDAEPAEFQILLSTGGPASRIVGELRDGEVHRAWLEVQDWGTPWTDHYETGLSEVCETYARCFYFGEC